MKINTSPYETMKRLKEGCKCMSFLDFTVTNLMFLIIIGIIVFTMSKTIYEDPGTAVLNTLVGFVIVMIVFGLLIF